MRGQTDGDMWPHIAISGFLRDASLCKAENTAVTNILEYLIVRPGRCSGVAIALKKESK